MPLFKPRMTAGEDLGVVGYRGSLKYKSYCTAFLGVPRGYRLFVLFEEKGDSKRLTSSLASIGSCGLQQAIEVEEAER
jgi:hypothetical protein